MVKTIALLVPGLDSTGGVVSVARFLKNVALRSGRYRIEPISLSTQASDSNSSRLLSPSSWSNRTRVGRTCFDGASIPKIGSTWGDVEFARYRSRPAIKQLVEHADLIQLVSGTPAWANCVPTEGPPLALQFATRVSLERRARLRAAHGLEYLRLSAMTLAVSALERSAVVRPSVVQVENPVMQRFAENMRGHLGEGRNVYFCPPGVDCSLFAPRGRPSVDEPYILSVGRLDDPRKNVELLFSAFAEVGKRIPRVRLITAGSRPPPECLIEVFRNRYPQLSVSHVSSPNVEQLATLYSQATCVCLTSDEEGFGMVVAEAMSCGVPVVATRCGGPEGIIDHGQNGLLVDIDDVSGMAASILRVVSDRDYAQFLGRNARAHTEERFSVEVSGARFLKCWDSMTA